MSVDRFTSLVSVLILVFFVILATIYKLEQANYGFARPVRPDPYQQKAPEAPNEPGQPGYESPVRWSELPEEEATK